MNLEETKGKSIAMIRWNTEKEDDVHVCLGTLQNRDGEYAFVNEEKGWRVSLTDEQLSRLKPVSEDLKETLLKVDYALSMTTGNLPDADDTAGYKPTGINWQD